MKAVRIFMLERDLTFQKMADRLGVSKSYIHEVLSGTKKGLRIRQRLIDEIGFNPELVAWAEPVKKKAA